MPSSPADWHRCAAAWVEARDGTELIVVPSDGWQALLPHLGQAIAPAALPVVEELAHYVRAWANRPTAAFCWPTPDAPKPEVTRTGAPPPAAWSPSQRMAESVAVAIRDGVHAGRLIAGERVTESYLIRATHASRNQVRDALRSLAADGLVDLEAGRGAVIPALTAEDVHETYALRHSLGSLIVDSAANWRPGTLKPLIRALDDLKAVASTGDSRATGDADLDSIEDIITDDTALLDAVHRRDAARARRLWEQKMDAAADYMLRQLEHSTCHRKD